MEADDNKKQWYVLMLPVNMLLLAFLLWHFSYVAWQVNVFPLKVDNTKLTLIVFVSLLCVCASTVHQLTIRRELVLLEHSDAQDVLIEVFDEELAVEVPLWVQSVADRSGGVTLRPHRQLAVRIAFTCRPMWVLWTVTDTRRQDL